MGVDVGAIKNRLKATECPAFWDLPQESWKVSIIDKLEVKNEEISAPLWRNIVLELAISYEYMKQSLFPVCSQKLQDCLTWVNNSDDRDFIKKYEASFRHLILSFKSFIALEKGDHSEALRCLNQVVDLSKMSKPELAAIYGIKSNVFTEYGVKGTQEAFSWARKALKLDDSEAEWYFLLGKLHFRQRNYTLNREPCEEEHICLEKAHQLSKKAHTAVYLATSYNNKGKQIYYKQPLTGGKKVFEPSDEVKMKKYYHRALELYKEAMDLNEGQCLHILIRCSHGLAILPGEFRNTALALELAEKVVKKSPDNAMVHSVLSLIYRNRREFTAAIIHAKRSATAGAFGSHLKLLNLYQDGKKEFDLPALLDRTLKEFPMDIYRIQCFIYASNYFLFVKRDLFKSLPYFEKAVDLDSQFNLLKDRYVRWVKVSLNLFELMYNEIECAFRKESYTNEDEQKLLHRVREKIVQAWPNAIDIKIEKDLVNKLKENAMQHLRARPRTRKHKKGGTQKKMKKGKNYPGRRLKSTQSVSAHSKERSKSGMDKMRSSSDDRFYHGARDKVHGMNTLYSSQNKNHNKRALSQDGRSLSRDCPKKMLKEMENLQKSISNLNLSGMSLRPDMSPLRPDPTPSTLERSISQLSLESGPEQREIMKDKCKKPNYFSKRSVSFDRQDVPQKRISAAVTPSKLLSDKDSFLPDFKTPSSVKSYGSLTVENVEKLKNSNRRDSLDSDDTLESGMSNLSLRESSNVGVCSATSVSVTTNRSLSLDDSLRSVSSGIGKGNNSEATDWASMCENDPFVSAHEPDTLKLDGGKEQRRSSSSGLVMTERLSNPVALVDLSFKPTRMDQTLAQRMRDLSLEKKHQQPPPRHFDYLGPGAGAQSHRGGYARGGQGDRGRGNRSHGDRGTNIRGTHTSFGDRGDFKERRGHGDRGGFSERRGHGDRGGFSERRGYGDRRSPFGRDPSSEARVLRPPGMRRRAESETSTSSADSDYIGSRWPAAARRSYR